MKLFLLVLSGLAYGIVTGLIFHRYSNHPALRRAFSRILAHILEFRLFIDEPRLIFRAQRDLVRANMALLRAVAIPLFAAIALLAVSWAPLQAQFGQALLEPGAVQLVSVKSVSPGIDLVAPFGVAVETPALRLPEESATVWRVRALSPVSGEFRTRPDGLPVRLHSKPAQYLGVSWLWTFGLASMVGWVLWEPGTAIAKDATAPNRASLDRTSSPKSGTA